MLAVNLWHLLATTAAARPDETALVEGDRTWTYRETMAAASRVAAALAARGIARGDRVACLCLNTAEHLVATFAAAGAGAVLVPCNTRLSAPELRAILQHADARALMHDAEHAEVATGLADAAAPLPLAGVLDDVADATPPTTDRLAGDDEPAQLYYTSGTTGRPKGVILTHRNVATHARAAVAELQLSGRDRWAHVAPMFHLADAWAIFAITAVGGCHVFLPRFAPAAALDLLERQRITITNLVPTMLVRMVAEPDAAARRYALRALLSGGAPIAPTTVRAILATFGCDYVQTYGMTETSPYLTLGILTEELRRLPADEKLTMLCKAGRPFAGVDLVVVDDAGRAVPADGASVGEIRVRGATVTPGYWLDEAATRAAFDARGYLCTGDLASIDRHGFVAIVDRKKDVIKSGGESVYSTEVEHVLYQHAAVLECAVFGVPDPVWGERVTAAVVLRDGRTATAEELIRFCRDHIAHFKAPRAVQFLPALPKTGSGKIQKRALREQSTQ